MTNGDAWSQGLANNKMKLFIRFPGGLGWLPVDANTPLVQLYRVARLAGWKLHFNPRLWRLEVVE